MKSKARQRFHLCLMEGKPDGLQEMYESNWTVHVLLAYRSHITSWDNYTQNLDHLPDVNGTGVYILLGEKVDEEGKKNIPAMYIGQSTNLLRRLKEHVSDSDKDWWEGGKVILVTRRPPANLNSADAEYLEARLIKIVRKVGKVTPENTQKPSSGKLTGDDKNDMDKFLDNLLVILRTLYADLFLKPPPKQEREEKQLVEERISPDNPIFVTQGEGYAAEMIFVEGSDFTVLAGSLARDEWTGDDFGSDQIFRKELIDKKILVPEGKSLKFTEDYTFKSASKAAKIVIGRNANGWVEWRVKGGNKNLRQWEKEQVKADI